MAALGIPLGHKDAAFVRSHFDAIGLRCADAPMAGEILLCLALTAGGGPCRASAGSA